MYCYKCGKLHKDNVNFCSFCGVSLKNYKIGLSENDGNYKNDDNYDNRVNYSDCENYQNQDVFANQRSDYNVNIIKNKKDFSVLGIVSLIFGLLTLLLFIYFIGFDVYEELYDRFIFTLPVFSLFSLVLSIIDIYKDNNFDRVIFSFYINFATFIFIVMYFGYVYLIEFFI